MTEQVFKLSESTMEHTPDEARYPVAEFMAKLPVRAPGNTCDFATLEAEISPNGVITTALAPTRGSA